MTVNKSALSSRVNAVSLASFAHLICHTLLRLKASLQLNGERLKRQVVSELAIFILARGVGVTSSKLSADQRRVLHLSCLQILPAAN